MKSILTSCALALLLLVLPVKGQAQVVEYVHTDALGSPVAITNEAGQVIERTDYEPYGSMIGKANNDRPGYTGHVMDSATGLTYMQQRYYDSTIGRFLSTDPVSVDVNTGASFNRYDYALNNPFRFVDPDGRQAVTGIPQAEQECSPECMRLRRTSDRFSGISSEDSNEPSSRLGQLLVNTFSGPRSGESISHWFSRTQCSGDCTGGLDEILAALPVEGQAVGLSKFAIAAAFAQRVKAVNLPGWGKLAIDIVHISERHMVGGALTKGKDVFVGLNAQGVIAAIRQAYGNATVVRTQGERVLLTGVTKTGMKVEIWLNKATKTIETAYPVTGR